MYFCNKITLNHTQLQNKFAVVCIFTTAALSCNDASTLLLRPTPDTGRVRVYPKLWLLGACTYNFQRNTIFKICQAYATYNDC